MALICSGVSLYVSLFSGPLAGNSFDMLISFPCTQSQAKNVQILQSISSNVVFFEMQSALVGSYDILQFFLVFLPLNSGGWNILVLQMFNRIIVSIHLRSQVVDGV